MIEVKNNFAGGLNQDDSYYRLPQNCYVDALNITRDAVSANADAIVSTVVGNRVITYSYAIPGTNTVIGAVANTLRGTVISLVHNTSGYHTILEYNIAARTATKVFQNLTDSDSVDILGFTAEGKITGINIFNRDEGDLLFFLDSLGRPTFMNITLFKAGAYTPVTRQIIDVGKIPPPSPPNAVYGNDATRVSNYLQKKLFRFKYRFVYDDDFKTSYSPISAVPLPVNILDPVFTNVLTNNNVISLSIASGAKNVKGIEIAVSIQNSQNIFGRFQTVEYIDKAVEGISDDTTFNFQFYNDSTYPTIADAQSLPLFDYVPRLAKSQEQPNGNTLAYGAITEGYDRDLSPNVTITIGTVAAGSGSSVGSLSGVVTIVLENGSIQLFNILFSGVPAVGTVINVRVEQVNNGTTWLAATYTTVSGDTAASVATAIVASFNSLGQVESATVTGGTSASVVANALTNPKRIFDSLTITAPATTANTNSIATWPFLSQRRIGIAYYDEKGVTNGILYDADLTFPAYAENGSAQVLLPYINVKIYHRPPDWAYSYQICFTKDNTQFLYIETVDVNTTETDYIYFDITNLALNQEKSPTTAAVVSWTFQDGDRMRLIRRMSDGNVFASTFDTAIEGIVTSPVINGVTQENKTFVKIRSAAPFTSQNYTTDFFVIQLYRPALQEPSNENATFYECGVEYAILNPTESDRVHAGQVTNQSDDLVTPAEINIYEGDVYFRLRTEFLSNDPATVGTGSFNVQDRNFVDFHISAVNNIDGRPQAIDLNARSAYYPALIRNSQAYQANTNINGFNRFYADQFIEVDYSYGDVLRLKVRDRYMRVYQKLKVGVIYLFSRMGKSPSGDEVTIVTDQLLNPVQYYAGDIGIGNHATSLASFNFADYFTSDITGGAYRLSNDGITPISILYKMNSWAISQLPLRTGNYNVFGAYDQKLNNYIMALEATDTQAAQTLTFSEEDNTFESFLSLFPEMMTTIGTLLCAFKNGQMWTHDSDTHNSFFGTSYDSTISIVFNDNPNIKKQPISITESASSLWDCPQIVAQSPSYGTTNQQSTLVAQEFTQLEGQYHASFKRDSNSRGGKINGSVLKGNWTLVKFRKQTPSSLETLNVVAFKYNVSQLNPV
jgi:hypothetical protein